MARRHIILCDSEKSPWKDFLTEFLEDTRSALHCFHDPASASRSFDKIQPDLIFLEPSFLSMPLVQKVKALQVSRPALQVIALGQKKKGRIEIEYARCYENLLPMSDFQKDLINLLPFPEKIRLLVIDDEPEVIGMVRDFFEGRKNPSFEIEYAENGEIGLRMLLDRPPDILLLDVKMPVKDGREVYREICQRKMEFPTIIFFDAIFGDEMTEIYKIGKPAVVEKGGPGSAPAELMAVIKKMYYFA